MDIETAKAVDTDLVLNVLGAPDVSMLEDSNPPATYRGNDYVEPEQKAPKHSLSDMDPMELIRQIAKFNPQMANKLFYKHLNQPRQKKTLNEIEYLVMPNGAWRRMTPKNNKARREIDPRSLAD